MKFDFYFAAVSAAPQVPRATFGPWDWVNKPLNLLVGFPYLKTWDQVCPDPPWPTKSTMLDSGAFSAWNSGQTIDFDALCIEAAKPRWKYAVALDVVGDSEASMANAIKMRAMGLEVIPVFHYGEPWDVLLEYKKEFAYIGLGGRPTSTAMHRKWVDQCFARVFPHRIHLFGCGHRPTLLQFPFTSADTASWSSGSRYGRSSAMPGLKIPKFSQVGGDVYDLRADILHYLEVEAEVQARWANTILEEIDNEKSSSVV